MEHTNACGLPQLQKILPDLSYCFCTWKEGCLFITSNVVGCSFYGKGSKRADLSFGEFANGNQDKFACNGYWVPSTSYTSRILFSYKGVSPSLLLESSSLLVSSVAGLSKTIRVNVVLARSSVAVFIVMVATLVTVIIFVASVVAVVVASVSIVAPCQR